MKRYFSMLLVFSIVLFSFFFPVSAAAVEANSAEIDGSFIATASVDVATSDNGLIEISLTNVKEMQSMVLSSTGEFSCKFSALTFLAETPEEKDAILSRINQVRSSGGTVYDDDWFFSKSCYIYISITYTTRNVSNGTEARINSVTTRYSVNSGTSISNAVLHLACVGFSSDAGSTNLERDIAVTTSPYTNTLMNSWPYINTSGPCLGANYTVTAKRPSGSSASHTVSATVFVN